MKCLCFEESVEQLGHIIAIVRTSELADGVHRKGGIADINGKDAVFSGKDRTDCAAALDVASIIENLIRNIVVFTEKLEYGGSFGRGCIGLRVGKLQNRTLVQINGECHFVVCRIRRMRCVRHIRGEGDCFGECAIFILCGIAKLFANAVDDLHDGIATGAAVGV